ncbi:hypothetical protein EVAR_58862_1 [Eumeta japonica]|uniref:Uncharacterized protein n=1 Tax=Eumeta variegata TaxID=151549 RepID=A0A4C1YBC9_EUMVA|nr:hypothetical protein EVAR_58862_1 [Eumeta japonica]
MLFATSVRRTDSEMAFDNTLKQQTATGADDRSSSLKIFGNTLATRRAQFELLLLRKVREPRPKIAAWNDTDWNALESPVNFVTALKKGAKTRHATRWDCSRRRRPSSADEGFAPGWFFLSLIQKNQQTDFGIRLSGSHGRPHVWCKPRPLS